MNRSRSFTALICFVFSLVFVFAPVAATNVFAQQESPNVTAALQNGAGTVVGTVALTQAGSQVWVVVRVNNMTPGFHGLQIHSAGQCGDPSFTAAGLPLGAGTTTHPNLSGDLPALYVLQDGTGYLSAITDRFNVDSLIDGDGSSVVVYANADNYGNIPSHYGITPDSETMTTGDAGAGVACGVLQPLQSPAALQANLAAIAQLPLDLLPGTISRDDGAEHGTLVLTLAALGGIQIQGQIASGAAGQMGTVTRDGDFVVFNFTEITYDVSPISLPGGLSIGPQTIKLDPGQSSTLRTNVVTGEIFRDFHWIQTATDVLYDGSPDLALGDRASAQMAEVNNLGDNRYSVRLLTHWRSSIHLNTWTIGGATLPSGDIEATAEFDGTYILDFNDTLG